MSVPTGYRALASVTPTAPGEVETAPGLADLAGLAEWRFAAGDGARVSVALLAPDLARVRFLPPGVEAARSWAVARAEWPAVAARVEPSLPEQPGALRIETEAMTVELALDPFRVAFRWPDGEPFAEDDPEQGMGVVTLGASEYTLERSHPSGSVRCVKRLAPGEHIFGAGERTQPLDRRGHRLTYWNVDPAQPHVDATRNMYASIPFWLALRHGRAYGVFLDSVWRAELDAGASAPAQLSFGAAGGDLTYYVFAGPTPQAVLTRYADLTGHMPLPPRWALGYHQSRWSYYPASTLLDMARQFRERRIPCDALWLDIDYMDGYRVFTWDQRRFPDPARMTADLAREGFQVVTIVDPGVKADPTDPAFAEGLERRVFVRKPDGETFIGPVWPGECAFPDFSRAETRAWWGSRHAALLDAGVAGVWDDMNEPALTDFLSTERDAPMEGTLPDDALHFPDGLEGEPLPHAAFHNAFGMQMARATFEGQLALRPNRRPFVLTRSGYAGVQRYAALWTGDNRSQWDHLALATRMCLGLGVSGLPFVGFDTGGFWQNATGELLARFTQLGAVFPFFRNHSAMGTAQQEPWAFGPLYEAICREYIELRYQLLPYLYTLFAEAARTGAPITRPLFYAFPDDEALAAVEDAFLLGDALLVAPALDEGQLQRRVQFPQAVWRDWRSGERIAGPQRRVVDAPVDTLPLYLREGTVLPFGPVRQHTGERPDAPLTLICSLGDGDAQATGTLYEDDGATLAYQQGATRLTRFTVARAGQRLTLRAEAPEGRLAAPAHGWVAEFRLPYSGVITGARPAIRSATLDGAALDLAAAEVVARRYETLARIPFAPTDAPFTLEVAIG